MKKADKFCQPFSFLFSYKDYFSNLLSLIIARTGEAST